MNSTGLGRSGARFTPLDSRGDHEHADHGSAGAAVPDDRQGPHTVCDHQTVPYDSLLVWAGTRDWTVRAWSESLIQICCPSS